MDMDAELDRSTDNQRFFELLTRHGSFDDSIDFRIIHTPGPKISTVKCELFLPYHKIDEISRIIQEWKDYNIYFGPALRKDHNGTKDGISHIPSLFVDIDFKDISEKEAWEKIKDFPIKPSAIIDTGGGLHIYWWLKEPLFAEEIPQVEKLLKRLSIHFGGDTKATDASHVMRVPGSFNRKPNRGNAPVRIMELNDNEIDQSDLDGLLPQIQQTISIEHLEINTSSQMWEKAKKEMSKHPKIMFHWMNPKPDDRSGHDWRLACLCIEEGITDPGIIYQIILNNPHGKAQSYPKTDKYIEEIISKCFAKSKVQISKDQEFPKYAIKGLAGQFADLHSNYLESPWSFFAFDFLTCLGNLISNRVTLASEIAPQPRFYTVNIGESADDRKSESIKKTIKFFEDTLTQGAFRCCHGVGSAEGLARKLDEIREGPKTLTLVYDELKLFVAKATIEGAALLPAVNSFFDSNKFHSATKTHSIKLDDVYLSILAASTLDTFSRMWSPAFLDIGFLNRLWIVRDRGERKFSIPREIPLPEIKHLQSKLGDLLKSLPKEGMRLPITDEARRVFDQWYFQQERSPFSKRLDNYGLRLMIVLSVNEGELTIKPDIAERVIRLLQWQLEIRRECDPVDAENNIAKMEEMIRRALARGPFENRELQRKVHYNRYGLFIWNSATDNLLRAKELLYDHKTKIYSLKN